LGFLEKEPRVGLTTFLNFYKGGEFLPRVPLLAWKPSDKTSERKVFNKSPLPPNLFLLVGTKDRQKQTQDI